MGWKPPDDEYEQRAARAQDRVKNLMENEGAQVDKLLDRIAREHGRKAAEWLVERWINRPKLENPLIEEQEDGEPARFALPPDEQAKNKTKVDRKRDRQRARVMVTLPTLKEVAAADRNQVCKWWYTWPARELTAEEQVIYDALGERYVEVGGYPEDFNGERLPVRKKRGAVTADVWSLYEEAKAAHRTGNLTMLDWAKRQAKGNPKKAASLYRKLSRQKKVRTLRLRPLDRA